MDNRLEKTYGSEDLSYDVEHLPSILKWIKPNSRVLEFGPAMGYMTRYMRDNLNCKVTAVEISPDMAKIAGQYTDKIIIANLDTDNWDEQIDGLFDYIIFADVLEHLRDPQTTIQKASTFLSPTGNILTSIPNIGHSSIIMSLMDGEFEYHKYGLLDNTHIHFFTRKSVKEMMDACGLYSECQADLIMRPGSTELKKFYANHPLAILNVLRKKDSSVYQFINKWSLIKTPAIKIEFTAHKLSLIKSISVLIDDVNDFCGCRFQTKISLPKSLKKIVRNG